MGKGPDEVAFPRIKTLSAAALLVLTLSLSATIWHHQHLIWPMLTVASLGNATLERGKHVLTQVTSTAASTELPPATSSTSAATGESATSELALRQELPKADLAQILDSEACKRASQSDYVKSHFFSYRAREGFNNRVQALQISLILAVALNRTLIVRSFTEGHGTGQEQPYTDFLEEIDVWPVTLRDEPSADFLQTFDGWPDLLEGPHIQKMLQADAGEVGLLPARNCTVDVVKLTSALAATAGPTRLMLYAAHYGEWRSLFAGKQHEAILRFVNRHVRFKQSIVDAVRSFAMPRPYALVHLRLGDKGGTPLANCTLLGYDKGGGLLGHLLRWRSRQCVTFADGRVQLLLTETFAESWQLPSSVKHVYIATNRPQHARVLGLSRVFQRRNLSVLTWESLGASQSGSDAVRDGSLISLYEEILAMEAEAFLPAWPSTWDSVVVTHRAWHGKPEAAQQSEIMRESLLRVCW